MTERRDEDGPDTTRVPSTGRGAGMTPKIRLVVAAVLAALLVVSAVAVAILFDKRGDADATLDARRDATRVAERFTVQVNNYDSKSVGDYQAAVGSMLSTKFRGEFEEAMEDIVQSVQEAEMSSRGTVLASGVASLDQDSAQVLVVADAQVKTVFDQRDRHFRWEVDLVKVDGAWLVDDFTPVQ